MLAYIHLNPLKACLVTRLDSDRAWTSHRAYLGKDAAPGWLTTGELLERFGGGAALHEWALGLHRGKERWPETGFDAESGFPLGGAFTRAERQRPVERKRLAKEDRQALVAAICEAVGVSPARLREGIRGARGNPERRFAVWALARSTPLTQREIGALLGMTASHVARDLCRPRESIAELDTWAERLQEKLSIVMD